MTKWAHVPLVQSAKQLARLLTLLVMTLVLVAASRVGAVGIWSPAPIPLPPIGAGRPELMSDGTLITMDGSGNCVRLTPDFQGSYANGTWTPVTPLAFGRWNFGTATLTNGNLLAVGGEYGGGIAPGSYWNGSAFLNGNGQTCEIYNQLNHSWAQSNPNLLLGDCPTELLPNGDVLLSPANNSGLCALYHTGSNYWEYGVIGAASGWDECSWVKLPNGCIFGLDDAGHGEHYAPASRQWIDDGSGSVGPGGEATSFLLPNGKVLALGQGTTNTMFYTSGNTPTSVGTWSRGPELPWVNGNPLYQGGEGGGTTLPNGNILLTLYGNSTSYSYEYDYQSNTFMPAPTDPGGGYCVVLPDGTVFEASGYIYTPSGPQLAAGLPVINRLTENANGTFHVTGLKLTGFTDGESPIDDGQCSCNFPLVRMTNNVTGHVYYARTFDWSSGGVQTGTNIITTEFSVPANLPAGTYSLVAVAMGIASAPVTFTFAPPAGPTGLTGTAGTNRAVLSWNAAPGATTYNVKQLMAGNPMYYATLATVTATRFTNVNLANLYAYSYVVSAVGPNGESSNSLPVAVTPVGPPAAPAGVFAYAATFARTTLNWSPVAGTVNCYEIKRATSSGGPYTNIATSVNPFYTDSGLNVGQTYYYVVSATNNYGEGSNSVAVSAVPQNLANLGFEIPSLGSGNYAYAPAGGFWTFSGSSGNGSGIAGNGSAFGNANSPEGVQAGLVQSNGVISQPLSGFVPGKSYVLTYSAAQRPGNRQTWNVKIDNTVIQTNNTPGSSSYADYSVTFVATAPVHTLSFVGTDVSGGDNTVFLDDVAIWPVSPGYGGNFGFEAPSVANYQYNPAGGAWTFGGSSGNGSGIVHNGSGFSNPNSPQGVQAAFVQAFGSIAQTFTNLTPGQTYTVSYLAAQRGGNSQTWNVVIDNTVIRSNNAPGSTSYTPYSAAFTATASSHVLKFVGTDLAGGDNTIFLDNVVVGVALSPLPPPAVTLGGVTNGGMLGSSVILSADVTANSNSLAAVQYFYDATNPISGQLTSPPYNDSWTPNLAGNHSVFARAFYNNGSYQDSPAAIVTFFSVSPATAADVVGSQVTFAADFGGVNVGSYQWWKISGDVTNIIGGATNTTLTLTNLRPGDNASYQLQAANKNGAAYSSVLPLTVNSAPSPVNNVITDLAAQTGASTGSFTPTWTFDGGGLIGFQSPSSSAGDFSLEAFGRTVASLTAGGSLSLDTINAYSGTTATTDYVTCGNGGGAGASLVYTLTATTNGYNLTGITVFGGWVDDGRDQQAYTVSYSEATAPATFFTLATVNYNPADPTHAPSATRAKLIPATGCLATNVAAVKFDFTTPGSENGYCGYAQIQMFGVRNLLPAAAPAGLAAVATNTQVSLSWAASSGATSYNVKRSTTNGGPYAVIASASQLSYADTAVINGWTYYYVVSATNSIGEGSNSLPATATMPLVVLSTTGVATNGQFTLQFQAAGNQSFVVQTSTDLFNWLPLVTNSSVGGLFNFTDPNATNPVQYYRVVQ